MKEVPKLSDFPVGKPNDAYAKYFIGQSWLAPLTTKQVPTHNVTFEPRCETIGIFITLKKAADKC